MYGAKTWTLRAADQKYLESFEMWCWRRMEKINWTDHVRNEEVLLFSSTERTIRSGAQPVLSLAIRLPERETEHSPSSRAEVGNACC